MNFETGKLVSGSISEQTAQVFDNLGRVLQAAGLGWEHVVKTTVFLTDMADFQEMNATYQTFFQPPYPARSTIAVAALPLGAQMEIELVARRPA
jgi:2-iminobutanoate/2-iminopropanoate deaminase